MSLYQSPPTTVSLDFEQDDITEIYGCLRSGDCAGAMGALERVSARSGSTSRHLFDIARFRTPMAGATEGLVA